MHDALSKNKIYDIISCKRYISQYRDTTHDPAVSCEQASHADARRAKPSHTAHRIACMKRIGSRASTRRAARQTLARRKHKRRAGQDRAEQDRIKRERTGSRACTRRVLYQQGSIGSCKGKRRFTHTTRRARPFGTPFQNTLCTIHRNTQKIYEYSAIYEEYDV